MPDLDSDTKIVYRIEHKDTNKGPFQSDLDFCRKMASFIGLPSNNRKFPTPFDDGLHLAFIPLTWHFGCDSLEDLVLWISLGASHEENLEIFKELELQGFVIRSFLVHSSSCKQSLSRRQVSFNPAFSREHGLVEELTLSEYASKNRIPVQSFGRHQFSTFEEETFEIS